MSGEQYLSYSRSWSVRRYAIFTIRVIVLILNQMESVLYAALSAPTRESITMKMDAIGSMK